MPLRLIFGYLWPFGSPSTKSNTKEHFEDLYVIIEKRIETPLPRIKEEPINAKSKSRAFQDMRRAARKNFREKLKSSTMTNAQIEDARRHYLLLAQRYYSKFEKLYDEQAELNFLMQAEEEQAK